jgi:hypothetical protein
VGRHGQEVLTGVGDPALVRLVEPADHIEEGGLPGPVGPDEGAHLALLHGEGEAVECDDAAEAHGDVIDRE